MTKEECIALLYRYAEYNGMGIPNLAGCKEAMKMAADLLSQPSLPSNLDEAAEEIVRDYWLAYGDGEYKKLVIAGAEWMAGQGETIDGEILTTSDYGWETIRIPKKLYPLGTEVTLQIRKKQ